MKTQPTTRSIRVYKKFTTNDRRVPLVHLCGVWLEEAGFSPGDYVNIAVESDHLTLTRTPWVREQPSTKKSRKK